eukprot:6028754-Prymnesium_polylepis.1
MSSDLGLRVRAFRQEHGRAPIVIADVHVARNRPRSSAGRTVSRARQVRSQAPGTCRPPASSTSPW